MDPITMAMMGGTAVSGLLSGLGGFMGGQKIAGANTQAAGLSMLAQQQAIQQAQSNYTAASGLLKPFATGGSQALDLLMGYLKGGAENIGGGGLSLISTFRPTIEQLESTPGYQFIKNQGLKAVQNSAAGKGLGVSGNALMGGVNYAEDLAGTTFQQQLKNYLDQNVQAFNMLFNPAQLGSGAAQANMQGTSNFNNSLLGAATNLGNTMAGGIMGAANAGAGGLQSLMGGIGQGVSGAASIPWISQMKALSSNTTPTPSTGQIGLPMNLGAYGSNYTSPVGSAYQTSNNPLFAGVY